MTTATLTSRVHTVRCVTPTASERALLRMSKAAESLAVRRMERRVSAPHAAADTASDDRRTALALGSIGILPR